ncbi:MAG: site-specific DNA-methyltransferase [Selenomonadaceae bacterium]|nr:site-specific DNA-methyltransferase [Selenomonadaceae bacterium]
MDKLKMKSADVLSENLKKFAEIFPTCMSEGKINFDALKQFFSDQIIEGDEAYNFTWVGKKESMINAHTPINKTLRPCVNESVNWDSTENLYIEGDNLEVLKLLQESYLNSIKMIYIDPPYNTGNDFIYRDNFAKTSEEYDEEIGKIDEENKIMFKNTDANGRFHSDWCSMIYSRLLLARNLLADDGVIFISIDDNEQATLKLICDEVFGERNFIATFPYRKRTSKSDVPFGISQDYEWIIGYAKTNLFLASIEKDTRKYFETPDFPNREWRIGPLTKQTSASERPNSFFTMINPKTGEEFPASKLRTWAITKETFQKYYEANKIIFPGDYDFLKISKPAMRYWKEDDIKKSGENFGKISVSTKLPKNVGMSQDGTKENIEIFNDKIFSFPKPINLIKFLIQIATDKNSIVLDFFSGSATTAHAVMQLNSEDGGKRKFIMVQLPELTDPKSEAFKAGYKNICEIGKERIRRAGNKIKSENPSITDLDVGFRVFKLDSTNMKDVYFYPEELNQNMLDDLLTNIKEDRTDLDLFFSCILDLGLKLSMPHTSEEIDGFTIHNYNNGDLIACFDENISKSVIEFIAKKNPRRAIFRDSSFENDSDKINAEEIFKLYSPSTRVKVI